MFVLHFLENEKRNGNLHGHIVSVNEAHQQSRREDANEVLLEEQITTVNEGRPLTKRNDWYINTDQLQLKFNFQTLSISKFLFLVLLRFLLSLKSCAPVLNYGNYLRVKATPTYHILDTRVLQVENTLL